MGLQHKWQGTGITQYRGRFSQLLNRHTFINYIATTQIQLHPKPCNCIAKCMIIAMRLLQSWMKPASQLNQTTCMCHGSVQAQHILVLLIKFITPATELTVSIETAQRGWTVDFKGCLNEIIEPHHLITTSFSSCLIMLAAWKHSLGNQMQLLEYSINISIKQLQYSHCPLSTRYKWYIPYQRV